MVEVTTVVMGNLQSWANDDWLCLYRKSKDINTNPDEGAC